MSPDPSGSRDPGRHLAGPPAADPYPAAARTSGARYAADLRSSGLPACWAAQYDALRPPEAQARAVRHTAESLARMPSGYRWGVAAALRLFPLAFRAATRTGTGPQHATPEEIRRGMARLRRAPGYAEVLRATTALALYGALDGATPREAR